MRIVLPDCHTLNPGDLDWAPLQALGDVALHPRSAPANLVPRCRGAAAVLTNKVAFRADTIAALPELRYIGVIATGYNIIDLAAARAAGITVTNVPAYSSASVAQLVFAHLLNHCTRVDHYAREVRAGAWTAAPDFAYWNTPLIELAGKTLTIIGFGDIGRRVGAIALGLGMQVLVVNRSALSELPAGVRQVSLEDGLAAADAVTLHCPLTPQTTGLINAARLALMKPSAFLINTGRGPLLDEAAVAAALHAGRLAGAGLDVLSTEPPAADNPLLAAPNCTITPHQGWATREARSRLLATVIANLAAWQNGSPQNVVS